MAFHHCWRGRWHSRELWSLQYCCEMIELADSRAWLANSVLSCAESVRELYSVLPFDFPIKSGSWIYFMNVGIHLLMCSGKLCSVPDFGDFCSWKCNFLVGTYGHCFVHAGQPVPVLMLLCVCRVSQYQFGCCFVCAGSASTSFTLCVQGQPVPVLTLLCVFRVSQCQFGCCFVCAGSASTSFTLCVQGQPYQFWHRFVCAGPASASFDTALCVQGQPV